MSAYFSRFDGFSDCFIRPIDVLPGSWIDVSGIDMLRLFVGFAIPPVVCISIKSVLGAFKATTAVGLSFVALVTSIFRGSVLFRTLNAEEYAPRKAFCESNATRLTAPTAAYTICYFCRSISLKSATFKVCRVQLIPLIVLPPG